MDEQERKRQQIESDFSRYGFVIIDTTTGNRVDPRSVRPMDEDEPAFNPADFFKALRQAASVKAGAIMFGQAQISYYDTLKEGGMSEEEAYNMLAHTTEVVVKGVLSTVGPLSEVLLKAAAMSEFFDTLKAKPTDKEVPGEQ